MVTFSELLQLQITREEHHIKEDELIAAVDATYDEKHEVPQSRIGHHQLSKAINLRAKNRHPETDDLMDQSLRNLSHSGTFVVHEIENSLDVLDEAICGTIRTSKNPEQLIQSRQNVLDALKKT
jgi:hypothetical protein